MDRWKLEDGKLVLLKRGGTFSYEMKNPQTGELIRKTCGKDNRTLEDARSFAVQQYQDMMYRVRHGEVAFSTSVSDACDSYQQTLTDTAGDKQHRNVIRLYIKPFLGKKVLTKLTAQDIVEWNTWKDTQWYKPFKPGTKEAHQTTLKLVLYHAVTKNWLREQDVPVMPEFKGQITRRPQFEDFEILDLLTKLRESAQTHRRHDTRRTHRLLFYYLTVMYMTGVRPGKELDDLQWKDVDLYWQREEERFLIDAKSYVLFRIKSGKTIKNRPTGTREVIAPGGVLTTMMEELKEWNGSKTLDDYVFRDPNGKKCLPYDFRRAMITFGMRQNDNGRTRARYSLRHSFATAQVNNPNVKSIELANHMGSSVKMLEKFYYHHNTEVFAEKITSSAIINSNVDNLAFRARKPMVDKERTEDQIKQAMRKKRRANKNS